MFSVDDSKHFSADSDSNHHSVLRAVKASEADSPSCWSTFVLKQDRYIYLLASSVLILSPFY